MTQQPNPKINRLKRLAGCTAEIRLHAADREFLKDLSRVQLLSSDLAAKHHYPHLKGGATPSLARLEAAGLIRSKTLGFTDRKPTKIYEFSSKAMARAWGGSLPIIGAKRNELHELITSDLYFKCGRPADYRLAAQFTDRDISRVGQHRPDALYTDAATGELVAVEADAGNYRKHQIIKKLAAWDSVGLKRIVWGQPLSMPRIVPSLDNITLHRF